MITFTLPLQIRTPRLLCIGIAACVFLVAFGWRYKHGVVSAARSHRVIVLGIDGMDYGLVKQMIEADELPNLAAIAREGTFMPLQTAMPPLSPVAWSNFMTGQNPGGHGVFDFLRRDPAKVGRNFLPEDAVTAIEVDENAHSWPIPLTDYVLPPTQKQVQLRSGPTLWQMLEDRGIQTVVYKIPANFPVSPSKDWTLSGMGTPDVEGTYGTFTYLTSRSRDWQRHISGGRVERVRLENGAAQLIGDDGRTNKPLLYGPTNPFRLDHSHATVPFDVYVDSQEHTAAIIVQDKPVILAEGEWSDWVRIDFTLLPGVKALNGICRFYLQEAGNDLRLFITSIHMAPGTEGLATGGFDKLLEQRLGLYATKGMAEPTKALMAGVLSEDEYLTMSRSIKDETVAALQHLLEVRTRGLIFVYFSGTDLDAHVFWKHTDAHHPAHDPVRAETYHNTIRDLYAEMDRIVGQVRSKLAPGDMLYVISDHGFTSLQRQFNLTTWLAREGYLAYQSPTDRAKSTMFSGVDWSQSRAYGLGFNGLYVNLKGREASGIVGSQEYETLVEELRRKLLGLRDRGKPVFAAIYRPHELYTGSKITGAPDLILGYAVPYGPADETVVGTPSALVLTDRMEGFTGHHSVDWPLVPGVLFSTRKLPATQGRIEDAAVTILREFGVPPHGAMTGKALYP